MIDAPRPCGATGWPEKLVLYIENENSGGGLVMSMICGVSEQEISTKTAKQIPDVRASRKIGLRLETGSNTLMRFFIARVVFFCEVRTRTGSGGETEVSRARR